MTNHQPKAPWRVEFNACGWSSRWHVVRGWRDCGPVHVYGDFTNQANAEQAAASLNNSKEIK